MTSSFLKLFVSPIFRPILQEEMDRNHNKESWGKWNPDGCNAEKNQDGFQKERSCLFNLLGFTAEIREHVGTERSGYCLLDFTEVLNWFCHQSSFVSSVHPLKQLIQLVKRQQNKREKKVSPMKLHRSLCLDLSYLTRAMCPHCEQSVKSQLS